MKVQYERVSDPCSQSSLNNPGDQEDLSEWKNFLFGHM
jgi:hypothetical protein